jgi:hypothetical protein
LTVATYATLQELKAALNIADAVDDTQLNAALTSASAWVDGYCSRTFGTASGTATKDYAPTSMYAPLYIDDATAIVEVRLDDNCDGTFATVLGSANWQTEPVNQYVDGLAYPINRLRPIQEGYWPMSVFAGQATVRVSATYGWPAVPAAVNSATIMQAARLFKRLDAPLGVMGFGDLGPVRVSRYIDPDVEALLAPYRLRAYL